MINLKITLSAIALSLLLAPELLSAATAHDTADDNETPNISGISLATQQGKDYAHVRQLNSEYATRIETMNGARANGQLDETETPMEREAGRALSDEISRQRALYPYGAFNTFPTFIWKDKSGNPIPLID